MARFTIPRDVYFGQGTIEELKNLNGKRAAIIIGGSSVKKNGALEKVEDKLKKAGMETVLIEGVEADPSVKTVMGGVEVMNEFKPDWIIGLRVPCKIVHGRRGFKIEDAYFTMSCGNVVL